MIATVGYPPPLDKTYPMTDGPTNPPRLPTELMSPIEAAAADSPRVRVGICQNGGFQLKQPAPMRESQTITSGKGWPGIVDRSKADAAHSIGMQA